MTDDAAKTKVLLWPSHIRNVFKGTQECYHVVDQTGCEDDDTGPTVAIARNKDEAMIIAQALFPGATITAVAR